MYKGNGHVNGNGQRSPTQANTTRIVLAGGIIFFSLLSLLYINDTFPSMEPHASSNKHGNTNNYGFAYEDEDGSKDVSVSRPYLINPSPEPDSATIDPTTGQLPLRKALVISSYKDQDVSWLDELHHAVQGWEIYRYVSDVPDTDFLPVANPNGREALPYLTFITDNYATLPDIVLFTHGHYTSWHQPEPLVDKIVALNLTAVAREDYVNIRCQQSHGCTEDSDFQIAEPRPGDERGGNYIKLIWEELMAQEVGPVPEVLARPCCAQFAVSKQALLRHSLNFWNTLREPLETRKPGDEGWRGRSDYEVGLKYEMFWHVLMGKPAIHCPKKEYCEDVYFQGAIHCSGDGEQIRGKAAWEVEEADYVCVNDLRDN